MEKKSVREEQPLSTVPNESVEESMQDVNNSAELATGSEQTKKIIAAVYAFLLVFGIASGYALSRTSGKLTVAGSQRPQYVNTGKVAGISDTKTFKDSAIGTLEKGGLFGEGTHKLVREGGPSQTVTLLSSAVDLDQYVGKKVKVWGQTMAAKKAAWLMDVGKIELQ